jgi:acetyl esterase/lipase
MSDPIWFGRNLCTFAEAFSSLPTTIHKPRQRTSLLLLGTSTTNTNTAPSDESTLARDVGVASLSTLPQPLPFVVPDPTADPPDDVYRMIRHKWPLSVLHFVRDSGLSRWIQDTIILLGVPYLLQKYPKLWPRFLAVSARQRLVKEHYGTLQQQQQHPSQYVELLNYDKSPCETISSAGVGRKMANNLVVFCHGGAWSSGAPWMYRLAAEAFYYNTTTTTRSTTVAIWGHRTYPDANIQGQVDDLYQCLDYLYAKEEWNSVTVVGHSSGGHVAVLASLQYAMENAVEDEDDDALSKKTQLGSILLHNQQTQTRRRQRAKLVDRVVAMSSPFDIPSHFEWETGRGVEEISALKPAFGYTMEQWIAHSPLRIVQASIAKGTKSLKSSQSPTPSPANITEAVPCTTSLHGVINVNKLPSTLFIHGTTDTTVPYTSSWNMSLAMQHLLGDDTKTTEERQCHLEILPNVGHVDPILHLMVGGTTRDVVLNWMVQQEQVL